MSSLNSIRKTDAVTIRRPLADGSFYEVVLDRRDLALYRRHRWQRHAKGLIRYPSKKHCRGSLLLHREILRLTGDEYALHINGNKFDCRRENLKVITAQEQRRMKKKPFIRTKHNGLPTGVGFCTQTKRKPSGKTYTYRFAQAHFCHRYRQRCKRFCVDTLGLEEAVRRALAWRVAMIRNHGLTPNPELLVMLDRVTRMARAGGGFTELYGGNAEYENNRIVASEVAHWAEPFDREAA